MSVVAVASLEKLVSPQMHLDCLECRESDGGSDGSFDPVEADALVESSLESLRLKHVDQSVPD